MTRHTLIAAVLMLACCGALWFLLDAAYEAGRLKGLRECAALSWEGQ